MKKQNGIALIEIMIGVLVFSIAVLGILSMQTRNLIGQATSTSRQTASIQSYAMADNIRILSKSVREGHFDLITGAESKEDIDDTCFSSDGCSSELMSKTLVGMWEEQLNAQLINGTGTVCKDSTPDDGTPTAPACDGDGNLFTIKIWWNEDRLSPNVFQRYVTTMEP